MNKISTKLTKRLDGSVDPFMVRNAQGIMLGHFRTGKSVPYMVNPWEVWLMGAKDAKLMPHGPSYYWPGARSFPGGKEAPLKDAPNPFHFLHRSTLYP